MQNYTFTASFFRVSESSQSVQKAPYRGRRLSALGDRTGRPVDGHSCALLGSRNTPAQRSSPQSPPWGVSRGGSDSSPSRRADSAQSRGPSEGAMGDLDICRDRCPGRAGVASMADSGHSTCALAPRGERSDRRTPDDA